MHASFILSNNPSLYLKSKCVYTYKYILIVEDMCLILSVKSDLIF